jgi:RNA polymerase sigma-70 factor (ECF subfamily)
MAGVDRTGGGPDAEVVSALTPNDTRDLRDAMRRLPPELSAVLVATAIDGLSTREAAHLLGIPRGTVKTRLMRARHQLQEALT